VAGRRERRQINEGRLRELAQIVDEADRALTEGQHHVNAGLSVAKEVGAAGPPAIANDRWEAKREEARVHTIDDLAALWRLSNRLRLRVADDHPLLRSFELAVSNLEQQTTAMAELLEVGSERVHRKPAWDIAGTARKNVANAQRDFEAAARELLGPQLERLASTRRAWAWRAR
jgi:hypothetical protein